MKRLKIIFFLMLVTFISTNNSLIVTANNRNDIDVSHISSKQKDKNKIVSKKKSGTLSPHIVSRLGSTDPIDIGKTYRIDSNNYETNSMPFYQNPGGIPLTKARFSNGPYTILYPWHVLASGVPKYEDYDGSKIQFDTSGIANNTDDIKYTMGVPNDTVPGAGRYIEFRVKASSGLAQFIKKLDVDPSSAKEKEYILSIYRYRYDKLMNQSAAPGYLLNDPSRSYSDSDGNKFYINGKYLDTGVGGSATVNINLDNKFIPKTSKVYAYMVTNTLFAYRNHPSFEAERVLDYNQMKGDVHNQKVADYSLNNAIKEIQIKYQNKVNEIHDNNNNSDIIKALTDKVADVANNGLTTHAVNDGAGINNAKKLHDSIIKNKDYDNNNLTKMLDIIDKTKKDIDSINVKPPQIDLISVPNLEFSPHIIGDSFPSYEESKDNNAKVFVLGIKNFQLNLSISKFSSENKSDFFNPNLMVNNNHYETNQEFNYYSYSGNELSKSEYTIPKPSMYLFFPSKFSPPLGDYHANATWNLVNGPS